MHSFSFELTFFDMLAIACIRRCSVFVNLALLSLQSYLVLDSTLPY